MRKLSMRAYFEKHLKIVVKKAGKPVPLAVNRGQRKVLAAIRQCVLDRQPVRIIILKSRQVGISTLIQALLFRLAHLFEHRQALVLAHKRDSAQHIFRMSKTFWEEMPPHLRGKKRHFSQSAIHFETTKSRLQVEVVGEVRSYTAQYVHLSELAFYEHPATVLDAILQCVPDGPDSIVVVESTPKGLNYFYEMWQLAKAPGSGWVPVFIPWFEDETCVRQRGEIAEDMSNLDAEETLLVEKHALTRPQLEWRRWAIRNKCRNDINTFRQEYPSDDESCFVSSGSATFDRDGLKHYFDLVASTPPPGRYELKEVDGAVRAFPKDDGRWQIAEHPIHRHQYIEGHDSSAGIRNVDPKLSSDPSPLLVLDRHSIDFVACFHDIQPPWVMAEEAIRGARYYNQALIAPEDNGHGRHFIREVLKTYHHMYFRESRIQSVDGDVGSVPGWNTNAVTRDLGIDTLRFFVMERMGKIPFADLLREMSRMQNVKNERGTDERPEVPEGYHDDLIMCAMICLMAHKGGLDAALERLPLDELQPIIEAHRLQKIARSMGVADTELPWDRRFGERPSAEELEKLDEMDDKRKRRREAAGLGTMT